MEAIVGIILASFFGLVFIAAIIAIPIMLYYCVVLPPAKRTWEDNTKEGIPTQPEYKAEDKMELFKKIFELPPLEVEDFIRNKIKNMWGEDEGQLDDYDIEVKWCVPYNEFYVHLEPKLETKDYKSFSFQGKENLTLEEYFDENFTHWHYTFQEIYGLMTGETTYDGTIGLGKSEEYGPMGYRFLFEKEYITVEYHKPSKAWVVVKWDYEKDHEVLEDIPSKLEKFIREEKVFDLDREG